MGYYSLKSVDIDCQGHQYGLSSNILRQRQMHLFLNNEHGIAWSKTQLKEGQLKEFIHSISGEFREGEIH